MVDWDLPRDPLRALADGDPGPFESLVRTHARVLVDYFRRQGAGLHRAEDLAQEVFLRLFDLAPRYRPEERLRALVLRVARNLWIDECRRHGARPARILSLDAGSADPDGTPGEAAEARRARAETPGPGAQAELREEASRARRALAALARHHREVFELGVLQELSYGEIASLLGIPVGTVKSRMHHAVKRLRQALEGEREVT